MTAVLITGAAGFIGRNLAARLTADGHRVRCVDNFRVPPTGPLPVPVETRDVRELTADDLAGVDTVVHLAALKSVPGSFHDPANLTHNLGVDHHILATFARSDARRLLMAGTCEVYGERLGYNRETDTLRPRSPYAVGKAASEMLAHVYRSLAPGKQIGVARFFNTYGPDEGADAVVPAFIDAVDTAGLCRVEGDGAQARDMTHIDDMVSMLTLVLAAEELPEVVNLGSGQATSVREIAEHIIGVAGGGSIEYVASRPNEILSFIADMSLFHATLGHSPRRDLTDGLSASYHGRRALMRRQTGGLVAAGR
ncbi:NAD-dependent epimerase/dehydratase family protein [Streptomyces sp. NPDC018610]|uniref:NAD-dependent epimerase/dehydratase family protein n=1 Tax=Streptomyces sp. NPDC018610 TaxID=3365049 RepID=UPI0037A3CA33